MSADYLHGVIVGLAIGLGMGAITTLLYQAVAFDAGPLARLRKWIADCAVRKSARECAARNPRGANHDVSWPLRRLRQLRRDRAKKAARDLPTLEE